VFFIPLSMYLSSDQSAIKTVIVGGDVRLLHCCQEVRWCVASPANQTSSYFASAGSELFFVFNCIFSVLGGKLG
jgi:hypothetical protein